MREPGNLQARADMMMSSMMGAIAFQKDLGAVHSCAHALGTVCDLHHGLANALMIDTVLAWNVAAAPEKFAELAHVVGASGGARRLPRLAARAEEDDRHRAEPVARSASSASRSRAWSRSPSPTSATRPIRSR